MPMFMSIQIHDLPIQHLPIKHTSLNNSHPASGISLQLRIKSTSKRTTTPKSDAEQPMVALSRVSKEKLCCQHILSRNIPLAAGEKVVLAT